MFKKMTKQDKIQDMWTTPMHVYTSLPLENKQNHRPPGKRAGKETAITTYLHFFYVLVV